MHIWMVEIQGIVQTHIITQINGIECYQIYFGYIKSDLDVILNEKQNYINAVVNSFVQNK